MARAKKCECEKGAPLWVVTFGDLMSLLLTFFVLLLSFATMEDPKRFEQAVISLRGAFGVLPKDMTMIQINPMPKRMQKASKSAEELARRLRRRLQILGKEEEIDIQYDAQGGLKISLPNRVLYESAKAELKPEAFQVLNDLGDLLSGLPDAFFEVRGHTDNRPLSTQGSFRDNYDLSFGRADAVARYLNQTGNIAMEQFEIVACGAGQPVSPNITPEGRQANRRVEIFVRGLISDEEAEELQRGVQSLTNSV